MPHEDGGCPNLRSMPSSDAWTIQVSDEGNRAPPTLAEAAMSVSSGGYAAEKSIFCVHSGDKPAEATLLRFIGSMRGRSRVFLNLSTPVVLLQFAREANLHYTSLNAHLGCDQSCNELIHQHLHSCWKPCPSARAICSKLRLACTVCLSSANRVLSTSRR